MQGANILRGGAIFLGYSPTWKSGTPHQRFDAEIDSITSFFVCE
jgi:hypothetical protein